MISLFVARTAKFLLEKFCYLRFSGKQNQVVQPAIYFLIGCAIALVAWRYTNQTWMVLLLIPTWAALNRRMDGFLLLFGYYLVVAIDAPSVLQKFSGDWIGTGIVLWVGHAAFLALPWISFDEKKYRQIAIIIPLTVLPPFGAFNWGHPMLVSGHLFPGTGLFGLLTTYILMIWLSWIVWKKLSTTYSSTKFKISGGILSVFFMSVFFICHITENIKLPPDGWVAINTHFGSNKEGLSVFERHLEMMESAKQKATQGAKLVVFPEGVGIRWKPKNAAPGGDDDVAILWMGMMFNRAPILVGADLPTENFLTKNAAIDVRNGTLFASARIPMPVGVWKLSGTSFEHDLFSSNIKTIDGVKTSMIFCYEENLIYPLMFDVIAGAKSIVSMSNMWSTKDKRAREMQRRSIELQAKLYGLPLLRAENK